MGMSTLQHMLLPVIFTAVVTQAAAQARADSGAGAAESQQIDSTWLKVEHGKKKAVIVRFELIAGLTGLNGALNFNGFRDGGLTVTVPVASTVIMHFHNNDGMLPHSAEVIADQTPVPDGPVTPVFARAFTVRLAEGLPPQGDDTLKFVPDKIGSYIIFCAVPGHGKQGMWIRLAVADKTAKPSVAATPSAHS